jgi:hypothetical protein
MDTFQSMIARAIERGMDLMGCSAELYNLNLQTNKMPTIEMRQPCLEGSGNEKRSDFHIMKLMTEANEATKSVNLTIKKLLNSETKTHVGAIARLMYASEVLNNRVY